MQVLGLSLLIHLAAGSAQQYGGYGGYGDYEHPKHNCSVTDVVEKAEVCTPALETKCSSEELEIKRVLDSEQCYTVARTVCSMSTETIDNQVCTYSYKPRTETTTTKTAEVGFEKECKTQMVTVCQPAQYGYGHAYGEHAYGENLCKEVGQETCYNEPVVTIVEPPVDVTFPEPVKACVNKPIALPRISCEDLSEEKCITVPKVEDDVEEMDKCVTVLADSDCQAVELTLPKQSCVELVYGCAETAHHNEPPPY